MKKNSSIIKSIPLIGSLLTWLHSKPELKPRYQYLYRVKPFLATQCINLLRKLIKFEQLILSKDFCVIDNGTAKFYWEPSNPYSVLGYPLRGDFEDFETKIAITFAKKSSCIVDVGGNFGWYACQLRASMPDFGEIHIFEPVPYENERLTNNLSLNCRDSVKTVVNRICLSDQPGEVILHMPSKLGAAFASLAEQKYSGGFERIAVSAETLDAYCEKNSVDQIDFLKIDVEGAELKVLKGANRILTGGHKPAVLVESYAPLIASFDASVQDVVNLFHLHGYQGYLCHKDGLIALENITNEDGYDYLFIDPANNAHIELVSVLTSK